MQQSGSSQLPTLIFVLVFVAWVVYRRTRPQRIRLIQTILYTALIVLLSLLGLGANLRLIGSPLFLVLAPFLLVGGIVVGWLMMRTIRFWREPSTGQVWMSGGGTYVLIWLAIFVVRIGIEYAATGQASFGGPASRNAPLTPLVIVASDLLFFSVGLWLARGYALVQRYRDLNVPPSGGTATTERPTTSSLPP